eukprot:CAMPEP_0183307338 /NCGR_PEP_ID=MMETSP0160_2-20130417/17269_1 /TAXON_ID=2839 ORGANISM="Odontella Sinensis, Strain Grunow 1884" /NCGR_SAMPLE_ID=MMETSP0160_2 /ASSEMBLY_ACC=CAM_ASM_000250 /LENGTH=367 /DNA_ID=CAMNT_0025470903 /DNA_START=53 /DNA_END=1156 /DNA_ORIENTATION=+
MKIPAAVAVSLAVGARPSHAFFDIFKSVSFPPPTAAAPPADRVSLGTLSISPVGFGTLNLPLNKETDDDALEVMKSASAAGVNFVDTAEAYGFGASERLTAWAAGEAGLKLGGEDGDVRVATKFAPVPWRSGAESVVEACAASRDRLGVDAIDLYQIHWPDIIQPLKGLGIENRKDELYWDGLARCYETGLARNVGVSNYGPSMIRKAHAYFAERGVPLVSNQINFSLLRYRSSLETLEVCNELGIKVLGYFPLGNGVLAGKYSLEDPKTLPSFPKSLTMKKYLEGSAPLLDTLRDIANEKERSCAQVAVNWVTSKGVIPIPGCRNSAHAADNFGALEFRLTKEEVERLDKASEASMEFSSGGFELE